MNPIDYRTGPDARHGGMDITISLTPAETHAIGPEVSDLADWLHSALWALVILRTGHIPGSPDAPHPDARTDRPATARDWHTVINDIDHRLLPRLEGVRDAAVRAHADTKGSVGDLALAMDVPRSTAQYRRETLQRSTPSIWEDWASHGGPQH